MDAALDRDRSQLLVIDPQERLLAHIEGHEALAARCEALLEAAARFGVPKALTEHCPAQIGPAVARLRRRFADEEIFVKTFFDATDHPAFDARLAKGRDQLVVAGIEAHVCVMQTVLGLLAAGRTVFLVEDAVGSRAARQEDRRLALARMRAAGAVPVGTETVLFEWTRAGDDPGFRATLAQVKALP